MYVLPPSQKWSIGTRQFFKFMRDNGWAGDFMMFGRVFRIVGMPHPWQADLWGHNDNGAAA